MLPFTKKSRTPREHIPVKEKAYGGSSDERLEHQCFEEMLDALMNQDIPGFRSAMDAVIRNSFEDKSDGTDPGQA